MENVRGGRGPAKRLTAATPPGRATRTGRGIATARNARRSTLFIRGYGLGADAGVYGTLVSPDNEITGIFAAPTYPTGGTREDPLLRRLQTGGTEGRRGRRRVGRGAGHQIGRAS